MPRQWRTGGVPISNLSAGPKPLSTSTREDWVPRELQHLGRFFFIEWGPVQRSMKGTVELVRQSVGGTETCTAVHGRNRAFTNAANSDLTTLKLETVRVPWSHFRPCFDLGFATHSSFRDFYNRLPFQRRRSRAPALCRRSPPTRSRATRAVPMLACSRTRTGFR